METDLKTRACQKCKISVPLSQLRLYPKDNTSTWLVCEKCSQELSKPKLASQTKPLPPAEYVWYACTRCKYNFKADAAKIGSFFNLKCPYCGKTDRLQKK